MFISRTSRTVLTLVAAVGLTAGSVATSSAAAVFNQTLSRSIYLADTSASGVATLPYSDNATVKVTSSGEYDWEVYFNAGISTSRDLELAPGTYSWGCSIEGLGVSAEVGNNYSVLCWLQNLTTPSDKIAYLPYSADGTDEWDIDLPQGTYTWYCSLQNN
jgi:hypothetical protein